MANLALNWLPKINKFEERLSLLEAETNVPSKWNLLMAIAKSDLDVFQTGKLDRALSRIRDMESLKSTSSRSLRIALIGTGTLDHLSAPIRIACARRNIYAEIYVGAYNQIQNDLLDKNSNLYRFSPDVLVLSIDARYAFGFEGGDVSRTISSLQQLWSIAQSELEAFVIQQTFLQVFPDILGNNEHFLPGSPQLFIATLNRALLNSGDTGRVAFLDINKGASRDGLKNWYDPRIWVHSKQEIHPRASVLYGEHVGRLIAAKYGRSCKCLVLDLDNTLWGGVIGDDGFDGIKLGQGSAEGEAFVEFQRFLLAQKARGIVLAVCSKNNPEIVMDVFDNHPEMIIRTKDIASFAVNWDNKADNLRKIAVALNIGTDSLLFIDDNPAEREIVRYSIPDVSVPEMPIEPAYYADRIAQSGYLEGITVTDEDTERGDQYRANLERSRLLEVSTDMAGYLSNLQMELEWGRLNTDSFARGLQLVNKTNQFNLTTRHYSDLEVEAMINDPSWIVIKARLKDKFGDNGIITLGFIQVEGHIATIDNWVMSCRVFGRQVEDEMMNIFVNAIKVQVPEVTTLRGVYKPTAKNAVVADLYPRLGFSPVIISQKCSTWYLHIVEYLRKSTKMNVREV